MPSTSWTSFCPAGPRWRTLSSGQIEVEGKGVPVAQAGGYHDDATYLQKVWSEHGPAIAAASARTGIPDTWIAALIVIESKGKNFGVNSAGAGGMMGMMLQAATVGLGRKATAADVADPATNIDAGAGYMAHNAKTFGFELPIIAVAHNAGSPKCSTETRCKNTIDGSWTFDGSSAVNSMGMVEDCTGGRSSGYALRAVEMHNLALQLGLAGAGFGRFVAPGKWGPVVSVAALMVGFYFEMEYQLSDDLIAMLKGTPMTGGRR